MIQSLLYRANWSGMVTAYCFVSRAKILVASGEAILILSNSHAENDNKCT